MPWVDEAARASVERVNRQIENLSKNYAEKLTDFFGDLTTRNQEAFTNALAEVKTSSVRLSDSVDGYSMAMRQNLSSIEAKVGTFADAVTERLRTTTFPDDYFAKHLEAPLTQLKTSATGLADGVRKVSDDVGESSVLLTRVLKRIRDKGDATEASLETVLKLTAQQQAVLDTATGQVTALAQLSSAIEKVDSSLTGTIGAVTNSSEVTAELVGRVSAVVAETEAARKQLQATMSDVIGRLEANAAAVNTLAEKWEIGVKDGVAAARTMAERFDASIGVAETVAEQLGANATASELVASKLDGVAAADARVSGSVAELSHRTAEALGRFDGAVSGLQSMVHRLTELDSAMRAQGSHLKLVADEIKNMKIVVTLPVAEAIGAAIADEKLVPQEVEIANPMVGTSSMAGA
ncbi:hypothetical protein [Aromatoleum aromaticum]|uniref:hypothetical protein n=1 Tax=Aromatoleum aromaticum TaxID=551760 RepID=UPI00145996A3|nr:hypothetical protein [Aromatoleum aromaticum]NMG56498.1 hypothetical protein [Aromatoleum aromaticum]